MNAAGQLAVREDAALNLLKTKLGAGSGSGNMAQQQSSNSNTTPAMQAMVDVYLLRFMRNKKLNIEETMDKLRRRRDFERSLPALSITPSCVRALRSGAFNLIGVDVMRRPVLYVRLNVFRSVTEPEEMEKLAIVLLEYMQSVAMNCQGGQEMVVLVGQQESTWYQSQGVGSLQSELLITLLTKYYPDLVGLVLMVDAPWATRQRVKTALSNAASSSRARNLFQIVSKADLQRFVDVSILPEDLGGRHPTGSAHDFSEGVLRHWYATVALINQEIVSGSARALYIPTAAVVGAGGGSGGGLASTSRAASVGNGPNSLSSSQSHRAPQKTSSTLTPRRSRGGAANNNADTVTDDGMCSVISDTDVDLEEDDGTDIMSLGPAAGAATTPAAAAGSASSNTKGLHHDLRVERDRRMALEHELTRLRLGITLDPSMATQLECSLRQVHEEINVVVAEVISRTKAATHQPPSHGTPPRRGAGAAASAPGGARTSKAGPSLHQLIETTDAQLLKIIQERQHVGAMKFATPPPDRKKGRGACSVM